MNTNIFSDTNAHVFSDTKNKNSNNDHDHDDDDVHIKYLKFVTPSILSLFRRFSPLARLTQYTMSTLIFIDDAGKA